MKFRTEPKGLELVKHALKIYNNQLAKVSITTDNQSRSTEIVRNLLLAQFCMVSYQNLKGACTLITEGDYYTPNALCRGILEHFISWAYIEKNPEAHIYQFVNDATRKQYLFTKILLGPLGDNIPDKKRLATRKEDLEIELEAGKATHGLWETRLEGRAREAGLQDVYDTAYRLLSSIVHPDALQGDFFFSDEQVSPIVIHEYRDDKKQWYLSIHTALLNTNYLMKELDKTLNLNEYHRLELIDKEALRLLTNRSDNSIDE